MQKVKEYIQSRCRRLDEWKDRISRLNKKAQNNGADERLRAQLASLRRREEAVRQMVESLRDAGEDEWKELKSGVEQAFRQLEESLRQASQQIS